MADEWNDTWIRYTKHRKATVRDWDSSKASRFKDSQYNPHCYSSDADIERIERACIAAQNIIRETDNKRTYYLQVKGTIVGVCRGTFTEYVFAEWTKDKGIHGRQISPEALRDLGVVV